MKVMGKALGKVTEKEGKTGFSKEAVLDNLKAAKTELTSVCWMVGASEEA